MFEKTITLQREITDALYIRTEVSRDSAKNRGKQHSSCNFNMCAQSRVFTDFAVESRKFAQTKSRKEDLVWKNAD
jgi:hypothetical protein